MSDTRNRPLTSGSARIQRSPGGIAHEIGDLHRLLVESVEDYAIFALDVNGNILSWNAGAQRIKGYTADEAVGRHFSMFYPPERVAEKFPDFELKEAARTGRFEDEGWRIRKDGSRFWANVVITALHNAEGKLVGYAKVTRDLSERRKAEEALRISEERFRLLVQGVKDYAIFGLDPTGHVSTWNEGAQRIKGYTADEIIGKHFSVFYPPEDIASGKPERELEIATRTGRYEEEGFRVRKDGKRIWASVLITALRNSDGALIGFAKVTRDLTERRAAEEKALEDARRVAAEETGRRLAEAAKRRTEELQVLTAALAGTHTVAEVANIVFTVGMPAIGATAGALGMIEESGRAIRIVADAGYNQLPERLKRVGLDENYPTSDAASTGKSIVCRSRAERDQRYPGLAEFLAPYDSMIAVPLAARGRTVGAFVSHRVAAHELTDAEIEFTEAFAQHVAHALERADLYEAEKKARARADEANLAKSEFLAAMSHELRTPLNAIAGFAELLRLGVRGPVNAKQVEDLDRIKRSQQHLLGIINDILNFAHIEAGQTTYEYGDVGLREVMISTGEMMAPLAAGKGLRFTVDGCAPDLTAWADKSKVEQILVNLLSNAVKFTGKGSVTMSCDGKSLPSVEITVQDTGPGIPAGQVERIFEPFVQVGRSLTSSREGTGLGLAICRDLARAMGGDVSVESSEGKGSTFTLRLPAHAVASKP